MSNPKFDISSLRYVCKDCDKPIIKFSAGVEICGCSIWRYHGGQWLRLPAKDIKFKNTPRKFKKSTLCGTIVRSNNG